MKTAIRQETVRFGRVVQCGRREAVALAYDTGKEVRLYWSHLRRIESGLGGKMFVTGETKQIHPRDEIVFVSRSEGYWHWGLLSEYAEKVNVEAVETREAETNVSSQSPAPEINIDAEMSALGSERIRSFKRRYPGYRPRLAL